MGVLEVEGGVGGFKVALLRYVFSLAFLFTVLVFEVD